MQDLAVPGHKLRNAPLRRTQLFAKRDQRVEEKTLLRLGPRSSVKGTPKL